ncbi:MAG: CvpA family protein [Candidatus Kerfeldbacteria bacterium]
MNWLDIIIIVWLATSLISGVKAGFVYEVATLIGFFVGLWFASTWTPTVAEWFGGSPIQTAIVFIAILMFIANLFGLVGWIANKMFKIIAIIPFLKTFNRLLGGILSVIISCFIISAGLFVVDAHSDGGRASEYILESGASRSLLTLSVFYVPFLSDSLEDYIQR